MSFTDLLPDTFTPQTKAKTADGQGGWTEGWTGGTDFSGRLSKLPVAERMAADKVTVFASHKIFCAASLGIVEEDKIKFGTRYFEVKAVHDFQTQADPHHTELTVLEIE